MKIYGTYENNTNNDNNIISKNNHHNNIEINIGNKNGNKIEENSRKKITIKIIKIKNKIV